MPQHRDVLEVPPFGPRVSGQVIRLLHDVLEPDLFHPTLVMLHIRPWAAHLGCAGDHHLVPSVYRGIRGRFANIFEGEDTVLQLKISAWRQRLIRLRDNKGRVFKAGDEGAAVDKIKLLAEYPLVFRIVDLELDVGWDAAIVLRQRARTLRRKEWDCLTTVAGWD